MKCRKGGKRARSALKRIAFVITKTKSRHKSATEAAYRNAQGHVLGGGMNFTDRIGLALILAILAIAAAARG